MTPHVTAGAPGKGKTVPVDPLLAALAQASSAAFAPKLAAALGPPGRAISKTTRTAAAEGEPAGSDSSAAAPKETTMPALATEPAASLTAPAQSAPPQPQSLPQLQATPRQEVQAPLPETVSDAKTMPEPQTPPGHEAHTAQADPAPLLPGPAAPAPPAAPVAPAPAPHAAPPAPAAAEQPAPASPPAVAPALGDSQPDTPKHDQQHQQQPTPQPQQPTPQPQQSAPQQQQSAQQQPIQQQHAAAHAPAPTPAAAASVSTPSAASAPVASVGPQSPPPPAPAVAQQQPTPAPQQPVPLADLARAAQTTIRVSAANGDASATIVLHPQELGTVAIRLHYTSDGVSAQLRADTPQAAQALQQAAPELRRALQDQGLALLDLDVRDRGADREPAQPRPKHANRSDAIAAVDDVEETDASIAVDPARLPEPGRRVDVLA